jgi:transposase
MGELQLEEHPAEAEGFVIDPDGRHARCPMGHRNESCRFCERPQRDISYVRLVWKNCCVACPRRAKCLGKNRERFVETSKDYLLLHERRQEQKTREFRMRMRQRNGIEGTISELVRGYGLRRSRYRGLKRTSLCHLMTAAACNVNRWLRRMRWEMQSAVVPA